MNKIQVIHTRKHVIAQIEGKFGLICSYHTKNYVRYMKNGIIKESDTVYQNSFEHFMLQGTEVGPTRAALLSI